MKLPQFLPRAKTQPLLVADIESGSVGLAILSLVPGKPARIRAVARTSFSLEEKTPEQSRADIAQAMPELAAALFAQYAKGKGTAQPERGYVVLHAPWVRSFGARVHGNLGSERVIEDDMVRTLAREAFKHMEGLNQANVFESSVVRVDLNGYPTKKPAGKRAQTVGVTALASDVEPDVRAHIMQSLGAAFPGRTWKERSAARVLISLIGERAIDMRDYVVVDMGTDGVDITAVRKNEVTEHVRVPEGVRSILRRITPAEGLPEERLALLKMLATDSCAGDACDDLRAALGKTEGDLARVFGEAFGKLAGVRRLPNTMLLSVHAALAPWLESFFARVDFGQFTRTTEPFSVETLTPEHVAEYAVFAEGVPADTGIAVAAAFVNTQERFDR